MDLSSSDLFRAYCEQTRAVPPKNAANGDGESTVQKPSTFSKANLSIRKAGGDVDNIYLRFVFDNLNIVFYSLDVSGTDHSEKIDFTFDKVTITYRQQTESGVLAAPAAPGSRGYNNQVVVIDFTKDPTASGSGPPGAGDPTDVHGAVRPRAEDKNDLFLLLETPDGSFLRGETLDTASREAGMEISDFDFSLASPPSTRPTSKPRSSSS